LIGLSGGSAALRPRLIWIDLSTLGAEVPMFFLLPEPLLLLFLLLAARPGGVIGDDRSC
jgi:hypothetical protein